MAGGRVAGAALQDACRVAVERLAGETLRMGASGDVAVRPFEDGSGIGDTEWRVVSWSIGVTCCGRRGGKVPVIPAAPLICPLAPPVFQLL